MEMIDGLTALYRIELSRLKAEQSKTTVIIPFDYLQSFLYSANLREDDVVLTRLQNGIVKIEFYYK